MILITAGTIHYPFPRLVQTSYDFLSSQPQLKEKVVIQSGSTVISSQNPFIEVKPFITLSEIVRYYQKADVIISAAGEASASLLLYYAKRKPLLFPRDPAYQEHIDPQQLQIAQSLHEKKAVIAISSESELLDLLKQYLKGIWQPEAIDRRVIGKGTAKVIELLESITNGK